MGPGSSELGEESRNKSHANSINIINNIIYNSIICINSASLWCDASLWCEGSLAGWGGQASNSSFEQSSVSRKLVRPNV